MTTGTKPKDTREIKAVEEIQGSQQALKGRTPAKVQKPENRVVKIIRNVIIWLFILGMIFVFAMMFINKG